VKVHLLRHGQVRAESGNFDPDLDECGLRQAQQLALRLRSWGLTALYSSDLKRALQTAQAVAAQTGLELARDARLREIDMGAVLLQGWGAYPEEYAVWRRHTQDLPYPGGENGAQVRQRVEAALAEMAARAGGDIGVVTHGGVIRVMLSVCLGMGLEQRFRFTPVANCSISSLIYEPGSGCIQVERVNDSAHLE
jgi:broad specificity phosphatase PhoE